MANEFDAPTVAAMLRAAVSELKTTLRDTAREAVATFERQTGTTPSALEIEMIDASPDGRQPYHIVGEIRVSLADV